MVCGLNTTLAITIGTKLKSWIHIFGHIHFLLWRSRYMILEQCWWLEWLIAKHKHHKYHYYGSQGANWFLFTFYMFFSLIGREIRGTLLNFIVYMRKNKEKTWTFISPLPSLKINKKWYLWLLTITG